MYTVVREYVNATELFDQLAQRQDEVQQLISGVTGFVLYGLHRSASGGFSITTCQDKAGCDQSSQVAADWIRQNLPGAAGSTPHVVEGEVIYTFNAEGESLG